MAKKTKDVAALFDLDDPKLAPEIDEAAITSGGYPYDKKIKKKQYEKELHALQIELLKVQRWARDNGERIVLVFEGRDAAGKGGTIRRVTEHLNPRNVRVVALAKPTDTELGQWYFQRYVDHMPTAGEMAIFDRSWYNRGGVERVMGFCSEQQTVDFLGEAPRFEEMLVRGGIRLFKFWLTIGQEMQLKRLHARQHDPLKTWKLSPIDLKAPDMWDAYTDAIEDILRHTDGNVTPWTVVRANDKKRTRLNVIRHVLSGLDYAEKDETRIGKPDAKIVLTGDEFLAS